MWLSQPGSGPPVVRGTLASDAECTVCLCLPLFCPSSPAHTRQLPLRAKLLPAPRRPLRPNLTSPPETAFHQQPLCHQPQAGKEPGNLWAGHPPGLLPQWPTQAPKPAPALAPMLLTGQAHPEPHDNRGHQKRSRATDLHCPPVAGCGSVQRGHQAMMGAHSQPATHGHSKKSPESSAKKMPGPSIGSATTTQGPPGWREGKREGGKRVGEKTAHDLRDAQ